MNLKCFKRMSKMKLRKRMPINYYKPEDQPFDEYIYCDRCGNFVYDYCSIHGPLLVIPDDKVLEDTGLPPYVPRSALTIPQTFLHLAPSSIPGAGLGVFSSLTLPRGVRFGPYRGVKRHHAKSMYCWQIHNENNKQTHVVDASDANTSNWLRYVNCARHWREQSLVARQHRGQVYYRTIKIIPPFTELLVFYGSKFAMTLNIDLRMYNSDEFYANNSKIGAPKKTKEALETPQIMHEPSQKMITITNNNNEDTLESYNHEIPIEKFVFIEEIEQNDTSQTTLIDKQMCQSSNETEQNETFQTTLIERQNLNLEALPKNFCHICQKQYITAYNLKRHLLTHKSFDSANVTNKYICDVCSYPYDTKNNLIRHIFKMHTNYKKSDVKFPVRSDVITQSLEKECKINVQKIQKNYCHICQKQLGSLYSYKRHLLTHTNVHTINLPQKYVCEICSYPFETENNLYRHIQTVHK